MFLSASRGRYPRFSRSELSEKDKVHLAGAACEHSGTERINRAHADTDKAGKREWPSS